MAKSSAAKLQPSLLLQFLVRENLANIIKLITKNTYHKEVMILISCSHYKQPNCPAVNVFFRSFLFLNASQNLI